MQFSYAAFWGGLACLVATSFVIFRHFLERYRQRQYEEQLADSEFEAHMTALPVGSIVTQPDATQLFRDSTHAVESSCLFEDSLPKTATGVYEPPPDFMEPAEKAGAGILLQLRNAGMLISLGEHVSLNGNPQGALVLNFARSKRALLIPYLESEAFLQRELRRYDHLIIVKRDGKGMMISSVEKAIADHVSGSR